MLLSGVLAGKTIEEVKVSPDRVVEHCTQRTPMSIAEALNMKKHAAKVPKQWQKVLGERDWSSRTSDSLWTSLAAWKWIVHWWKQGLGEETSLEDGWIASVLGFKDIVLDTRTDKYYLVLVPGDPVGDAS